MEERNIYMKKKAKALADFLDEQGAIDVGILEDRLGIKKPRDIYRTLCVNGINVLRLNAYLGKTHVNIFYLEGREDDAKELIFNNYPEIIHRPGINTEILHPLYGKRLKHSGNKRIIVKDVEEHA